MDALIITECTSQALRLGPSVGLGLFVGTVTPAQISLALADSITSQISSNIPSFQPSVNWKSLTSNNFPHQIHQPSHSFFNHQLWQLIFIQLCPFFHPLHLREQEPSYQTGPEFKNVFICCHGTSCTNLTSRHHYISNFFRHRRVSPLVN